MKATYLFTVLATLVCEWCSGASLLETIKHDLQIVNKDNFNTVINKFRNEKVFTVLFFKKTNQDIKKVIENYNEVANKFKGIITMCIIDCDLNMTTCENELSHYVSNYSTNNNYHILIYPINPMPKFIFNEEINENNIKKYTYLIPSKIDIIKENKDFHIFISKYENIPKVLIFSHKNKPNYILNALSNHFNKKLIFCFINNNITELVNKYNVKLFPTLLILKKNKILDIYKGKFNFLNIFDWLNIHSETFVFGGGFDISPDKNVEKPWKFQLVPKFTKLSHGDICFKKADKGLCLIYLKEGDQLEKIEVDMLLSLKEKFKPHIDGRYMWMDISTETNFRTLFELKKYPSVVIFNPYKRIRYAKLNDDLVATKENIEKLLEKISGGDAKFTMLKGQTLPEFVQDENDNKANEKDEL
ncbi:hypothetical protein, conserved in Apicomplexan species [Plasmodium ovale wallikeri]|uniref:Thioredoxin domain-containing protein n=1 Tax=Plasmodium ovale wallikeri TaxID=864142 RepID=A0A1A8YTH7_PLAOA|nr:hypothetical protein, conserved in Apicomplexan species [Plasmodium ovale wallikeri]SBT35249.1 hypothetical protein, conserved in Apicomplexan species [Plasmodium ovale wallikeri]